MRYKRIEVEARSRIAMVLGAKHKTYKVDVPQLVDVNELHQYFGSEIKIVEFVNSVLAQKSKNAFRQAILNGQPVNEAKSIARHYKPPYYEE